MLAPSTPLPFSTLSLFCWELRLFLLPPLICLFSMSSIASLFLLLTKTTKICAHGAGNRKQSPRSSSSPRRNQAWLKGWEKAFGITSHPYFSLSYLILNNHSNNPSLTFYLRGSAIRRIFLFFPSFFLFPPPSPPPNLHWDGNEAAC